MELFLKEKRCWWDSVKKLETMIFTMFYAAGVISTIVDIIVSFIKAGFFKNQIMKNEREGKRYCL